MVRGAKARTVVIAGLGLAMIGASGCEQARSVFRDRSDLVADMSPCREHRFEIYFVEGQARLTPPARELIALTAEQMRDCRIDRVHVTGLSSATGSAAVNQRLSEQRAEAVVAAMREEGWPVPGFEVEAMGEEGARTEGGGMAPLRRRTEVFINAAPR